MTDFEDRTRELTEGRVDIRLFEGFDSAMAFSKHELGIIMNALFYRINEDPVWADEEEAKQMFFNIRKELFVTPNKLADKSTKR